MQLEKLIAVIVLYKSTLDESESFRTLLKANENSESVLTLLVYNNSPEYWVYNNEEFVGLSIIYVSDPLNSGVSKAYNLGYKCAIKLYKEYILLLDQDTSLEESFFKSFFDAKDKYTKSGNELFCPMMMKGKELLSPGRKYLFTTRKIENITAGEHVLKDLAVINSGLIISVDLFGLVGGFNEKIKLDFSDFDFLKRSLKFSKNIIVLDTSCQHTLSSEGYLSMQSALIRFDYYLEGAFHLEKSRLYSLGLMLWSFLRALKLDFRYKTISFTSRIIQFTLKKI